MWKDILKKNAVSIACGVVALIALIAAFFPGDGMVQDLQSKLEARKTVYTTLNGLKTKQRHLPNLNPGASEAELLKTFPSEKVIAEGEKATQKMKEVSKDLYNTAVQINQHQLLVDNSLPSPTDVPKLSFKAAYIDTFKLRPDGNKPLPDSNIPYSILKGTQPPTPEEINVALDDLWNNNYVARVVTVNGAVANGPQLTEEFMTEGAKLPDVMRQKCAEDALVYIMDDALTQNTSVQTTGVPNENDIWYAQLGVWIQQDVARAIRSMNEAAVAAAGNAQPAAGATTAPAALKGILAAPVKRVVTLLVPRSQGTAGGGSTVTFGRPPVGVPGGEEGAAAGGAVPSDPAALLTFDFANSPTGRISTGLYDVYDFQLTVDIEASHLANFINELTKGRYIGVHTVDLTPVDLNTVKAEGFVYGNKPVVRAVLHCEEMLLRKWTEPLMPAGVKKEMNIAPPPAAVAAQ